MPKLISRKASRATLWIAAAAIAFAALSPFANALRIQSPPKLKAELCTALGFITIAADDDEIPATPTKHAPQCAWCLGAASWLALAGSTASMVPAAANRQYALPIFPQLVSAPHLTHAFAWAHAPPAIS